MSGCGPAGCALPLLVGAGVLTAGAAVALEQAFVAAAAGLVVFAVVFWGLHRRRHAVARVSTGQAACGCGGGGC